MSLWLQENELIELTGWRQRKKQRLALAELSIKFRTRPADGFPLVERAQFENLSAEKRRREPDWSAIHK